MTSSPAPRLPPGPDSLEWIERSSPLRFAFEGVEMAAYAGDSIASALWASDVRVLGHSLKKRRPRGLDANVAVIERSRGLLVAETTPIADGMILSWLHRPAGELPAWTAAGSKLAPGGLHDPARLADGGFERTVRSWVGLGPLPSVAAERWTSKASEATDVLVIGAGIAGLSAALAAAERGLRVLVVESDPGPGGRALAAEESRRALGQLLTKAGPSSGVVLRSASTALGIYDDGLVPVLSAGLVTKVRARCVILATGRLELPAVFRNNDLPGVVSAATAERLLFRYGVMPCRRAVVLTANDQGLRVAAALREAGVEVAAIVDARQGAHTPSTARGRLELLSESLVYQALAASDGRLSGVVVHGGDHPHGSFACDGLVVAGGSIAADALVLQAQRRHAPRFGPVPAEVARGVLAAGSLRGFASSRDCIDDGARVGALAAASLLGGPPVALEVDPLDALEVDPLDAPSGVLTRVPHASGACFIDLDEDVELADLDVAIDEGFDQVGLLNAYTKFGRGVGQSKTSHALAVGVLEDRVGASAGAPGRPVPRPPIRPVPMRALAGRRFHPQRRTPIHDWHVARGAELLLADDWERPAFYPPGGAGATLASSSRAQAIEAEVRLVRERVGIIDVGTLGKIDVAGRDAGAFLEQVYTGKFADMRVGTSRYALLCDDAGAVVDDGIVARFADDRFYVTTTTSASAAVYRELQRRAIELVCEVVLTNLSGATAAFNVAGPCASRVVAAAADDPARVRDLPYLGAVETTFGGVTARVLRVGFVGEIGFELHLGAGEALSAWRRLIEMGASEGLGPFGVEAQRMLRLEKGHLVVGQDTDALSTPFEVGLGWAVKMQKASFVGRRSLAIRSANPPSRKLVGFELASDPAAAVLDIANAADLRNVAEVAEVKECDLVVDGDDIVGRVTSVGWSPSLGRTIGLAFVAPTSASLGSSFTIRVGRGRWVGATVVATPFFDPQNRRQHEGARA